MFPARTLITVTSVACLALLAGCGGSDTPAAKGKSFEEALGFDQASMNAREAKVQEAVRTCMKAQGFDYVPVDPSQGGMQVRVAFGSDGPGGDDPEFRKTKGYGISTGLTDGPASPPSQSSDPNQKIREGLSEADQVAYEAALHGAEAAEQLKQNGDGPNFVIRRDVAGSSSSSDGGPSEDQGCFGKAQQETPGGPKGLGNSLQELQQRIDGDPRLVTVNQKWASCMAKAGFASFEKPQDIIGYLIGKMQTLTGSTGDGISIDSTTNIDQTALSQLQQEELAIARADVDCAEQTGRAKIAKQVTDEAQQRFLDEHPDLTGGQ
jgi:hypothetical protein